MLRTLRPTDEENWIVRPNESLRIISDQVWDRVQSKLKEIEGQKANTHNKSESLWGTNRGQANHFFTGTMCCDQCGGNFIVVSGRRGGYMGCHNAYRKNTCSNKRGVRLSYVEATMLNLIKGWLEDPELAGYMCGQFNKRTAERESRKPNALNGLKSELDKVQKAIANLVRFLAEGNVSEAVAEDLKQKEARKKELEVQIEALTPRNEDKPTPMIPETLRQLLVNLDEILKLDVKRANSFFKKLFPKPMRMRPKSIGRSYRYEACGKLDLTQLVRKEYSVPVDCAPGRLEGVHVDRSFRVRIKNPKF